MKTVFVDGKKKREVRFKQEMEERGSKLDSLAWRRALRAIAILWTICMVFTCSSCSAPMNYVHPTADLTYITTVAVVPFENLTQERDAAGKVMNVVAAEILRRGVFDVVEFGEVARVLNEEGFQPDEGTINKRTAERA